jgi:PAS domain S-box-containing protein
MNAAPESDGKKREVILVVDDSEKYARCCKAFLEKEGYTAITAADGAEAVEIVRKKAVDLVLMDIAMPGMDGITAAGRIKSIAEEEGFLPVVLVTGFANEETKVAGLSISDGFLSKPVSNAELLATVRSLLRTRRLTRDLARTKERYRRFYDGFPQMYLSASPDGTIISCNDFFAERHGRPKSEIEGTNLVSFLAPAEREGLLQFFESVLDSDPVPLQQVFTLSMPGTGRKLQLSVKAIAVEGDDGVREVLLLIDDVTRQLALEAEQKSARRHLYRSAHLASIGTLASGVAHEMNNPLTAILGFSSALLNRINTKEAIDTGELGLYLQVINNEAVRCRDIVDHLHRFAQDQGETATGRLSLFECVVNALRLVNIRALRKDITIVNEMQEYVWVKADANKLEQVFVNVLNNCIDFCGPGTAVTIARARERQAPGFARVTISDKGPGMTPDVLARALDPFFTTKEAGKGIGMGLALCDKIMEDLDGRISIASEAGKGTTVIIDIPYDKEPSREAAS